MMQCQDCGLFFTTKGKCPDAKRLDQKQCKRYRPGRPYAPKFLGKKLTEIKFDPTKQQAWSFWPNSTTVLIMVWNIDHNDYGHFRIFLLGLDDNGVVTKQFTKKSAAPAFFGEIVVKGPGQNDVWSSYGFEDQDIQDAEGNVLNKPREVKLYPKRQDS